MPYIIQDYRLLIYPIIMEDEEIEVMYTKLKDTLNKFEERDFDGVLNYTCTQLLRKLRTAKAHILVQSLLYYYYLDNPSYCKLKDCEGLLRCMEIEFSTRNWINSQVIKVIQDTVDTIYKIYELKKRESNGDLE